jgi:hypothetical protein
MGSTLWCAHRTAALCDRPRGFHSVGEHIGVFSRVGRQTVTPWLTGCCAKKSPAPNRFATWGCSNSSARYCTDVHNYAHSHLQPTQRCMQLLSTWPRSACTRCRGTLHVIPASFEHSSSHCLRVERPRVQSTFLSCGAVSNGKCVCESVTTRLTDSL